MNVKPQIEPLLMPGEVAQMFRVNPKTVRKWALDGKIGCYRTAGGHRRYKESEIRALLASTSTEARRGVAG